VHYNLLIEQAQQKILESINRINRSPDYRRGWFFPG